MQSKQSATSEPPSIRTFIDFAAPSGNDFAMGRKGCGFLQGEIMKKARGSIWKNSSKRAGMVKSVGSYEFRKDGDRIFVLTAVKSGKTKVYESPNAAIRDGWFISVKGE